MLTMNLYYQMKEGKKEEFIKTYNDLTAKDNLMVDKLYMFSCLKASGFNDELGQKLIPLLKDLWLDDMACRCISQLSDNLYAVYEENGKETLLKLELDEAEEVCMQNFRIAISKNLADIQCFGSTDIDAMYNQQFGVEGDFEALYNSTTSSASSEVFSFLLTLTDAP